ncbi:MAG: glycosyltransferase [Thiohalobacterales bacterium]|nr:glycosyltransferase [Thiohalobacterales bacterium]
MTDSQLPLITVRIPAYNHERYVRRALDSVLEQRYPNLEIVIIDDGSTDATAARIREWIDQHGDEIDIRFISRENRGISATLNELIQLSNGEYLVGLASDDYLTPDSISIRYEYLASHPDKQAVIGDVTVVDENGELLHDSGLSGLHTANKENYLTDRGLKKEIIQNWSVPGSSIMVRRELHDMIHFDERLQFEDRDFYLKMIAGNLLGFVDRKVSCYRVHGRNACMSEFSRLINSKNKIRSLLWNINRFSVRDRLLFIRPVISAALGVVTYSTAYKLKKLFG